MGLWFLPTTLTYFVQLRGCSPNQLKEAEKLIEEIPLDKDIYDSAYPILEPGPWGESYIDASEYFIRVLKILSKKSQKKKIKGIARGLRGLFLYSKAFEEETLDSKLQVKVREDLEYALKEFPNNKKILEHLWRVFKDSEPSRAGQCLIQCILNGGEDIYGIDDFIEGINAKLFDELVEDFLNKVNNIYIPWRQSTSLLEPIVERLYKEKRYKDILITIANYRESQLNESNILFEIAYSYSKERDAQSSKKYYELYLSKKSDSNAALNNLGLIFEQEGNLLKAKELFLNAADCDSKDQICRNNLKRVEETIRNKGKLEYELHAAVEIFRNESPYVHKKILDFYSHRNADGLIICPYKQAPQYLKMSGIKAVDFLNNLLSEKILIKVTDHNYNTQSNVYKLNPYIEHELSKIEESLKNETEFLLMSEKLNNESLRAIGYEKELLKNVEIISSDELKVMMYRDLKENAIALILQQNKSALILSGSIIEAILTDRIIAKNNTKYTVKNVLKMDLNELLDVAEKEEIIDSTMSHLAHGVRGYRNLIHPGVEQRKKTLKVNDTNVDLAWRIVKKILYEIK